MTWHKPKQVKGGDRVYPSINSAAKALGVDPANIWKALVGKRPSAYGYRWVYEERV